MDIVIQMERIWGGLSLFYNGYHSYLFVCAQIQPFSAFVYISVHHGNRSQNKKEIRRRNERKNIFGFVTNAMFTRSLWMLNLSICFKKRVNSKRYSRKKNKQETNIEYINLCCACVRVIFKKNILRPLVDKLQKLCCSSVLKPNETICLL